MPRVFHLFTAVLATCLLAQASSTRAQSLWGNEPDVSTYVLEGSVGSEWIGMNLTVRDHTQILAGHFYHPRDLVDTALEDGGGDGAVRLLDPDGGVFDLRFAGEARHSATDFYTSTRLEGTWTKDGHSYPVSLGFKTIYPDFGPERWYEHVTADPDAVFEARARRFLEGVRTDDRETAADAVSYPMTVDFEHTVRNRRELLACWDTIFTPGFKARLERALPHEMFVHRDRETGEGVAMTADADLWFDGAGVVELRPGLEPSEVKRQGCPF